MSNYKSTMAYINYSIQLATNKLGWPIMTNRYASWKEFIINDMDGILHQRSTLAEGEIDWRLISKYGGLSESFMRAFSNELYLEEICRYQKLSEAFIYDHLEQLLDFGNLSICRNLPETIIRTYADALDWDELSEHANLSESFMREFADRLNWLEISYMQKLSEDFIREFADRVDWEDISANQKLSEDFIREFADRVDWANISHFQDLTIPLLLDFEDRLDWDYVSENKHLTITIVRCFRSYLTMSPVIERCIRKDHATRIFANAIDEFGIVENIASFL